MKRKQLLSVIVVCIAVVLCSCESHREKQAIEICQETKIQMSMSQEEGTLDDPFTLMATKIGYSMIGLDLETSTWLDFANKMAEMQSSEKFHWMAEKTDTKNVYQVGFVNEENWGHFWEVNIKEKIVRSINAKETLARNYGHSRLDSKPPFTVQDIKVDTLKRAEDGVYYEISGKIVNKTGKSISDAQLSGKLSLIFDKKTEDACNSWRNGRILGKKISESNPWYNNEAISFKIQTESIKKIYLDYDPEYVFFTLEMDASDPVGYSYNKAIYEVDMKARWNKMRR